MFDELNEDNFVIYAAKCYTSPSCLQSEFEGDLKRTKYLKRLLRRYKITKNLKERLILNHIILLNNVFGPEATARILFFRIDEKEEKRTLQRSLFDTNDADNNAMMCAPDDISEEILLKWVQNHLEKLD